MRINRHFSIVFAALSLAHWVSVAEAAPFAGWTWTTDMPGAVVLLYDPTDGHLSMNGNGLGITTFELKSAGAKFIPENVPAGTFQPPFDVAKPTKLFKLSTGGVGAIDFGNVLPAGLSFEDVMRDLNVNGSILPRGYLTEAPGGGPYLYGPEPSSFTLIGGGLLGLLGLRRK